VAILRRKPSDGGAAARVKHVERLRIIEAAAHFWPIDRRDGRVTEQRELVVMPIKCKRVIVRELMRFRCWLRYALRAKT